MKRRILLLCSTAALLVAGDPPRMPMPIDYANSIQPRWLAKEVIESRLLDGMESMDTWEVRNTMQAKGTLGLTTERKVEGSSAIRLRSRTVGDTPLPNSRHFGSPRRFAK
jgi:hypothetical protein